MGDVELMMPWNDVRSLSTNRDFIGSRSSCLHLKLLIRKTSSILFKIVEKLKFLIFLGLSVGCGEDNFCLARLSLSRNHVM